MINIFRSFILASFFASSMSGAMEYFPDVRSRLPDVMGFLRSQTATATSEKNNISVFGADIDSLFDKEHALLSPVKDLFNFFDDEKSILEEGLLRLSISPTQANALKSAMAKGEEITRADFESIQVSAILKQLFRELPTPLLDFPVEILEESLKEKDKEERQKYIKEKLDELLIPGQNAYILAKKLFSWLSFIASRSDINKMTSYNLAVAIGPSLGRKSCADLESGKVYAGLIIQLIKEVIDDCEFYFGPEVFGLPVGRVVKNGQLPKEIESVFNILIKHNKEDNKIYFDPYSNCMIFNLAESTKAIEKGHVIEEPSAYMALDLLKSFLRELPHRLAPLPAHDLILSMQPEQYHFVIKKEIIEKLSPDAYVVFKKFISLFAEIKNMSEILNARYLADAFNHALFLIPENIGKDQLESVNFLKKLSVLTAEMINNYSVFFGKEAELSRSLKKVFDDNNGDIERAIEALKKSPMNPLGAYSDEQYASIFEWVLEDEKIQGANELLLMNEASRLANLSNFPLLDGSQTMLKYLYERELKLYKSSDRALFLARMVSKSGETLINNLLKLKQTNITLDILKDLFVKVGYAEVVAQAKRNAQPDAIAILFNDNRADIKTPEFEATKSFYFSFYCKNSFSNICN